MTKSFLPPAAARAWSPGYAVLYGAKVERANEQKESRPDEVAILSRAAWLKPGSALFGALRGAIDAEEGQTTGA